MLAKRFWFIKVRVLQTLPAYPIKGCLATCQCDSLDIFNLTNRANFDNPSGDERVPATFLVLTALRGGGGFPRQAKVGVRLSF